MLERMIELCLPTIIGVCELCSEVHFLGYVTTVRAFWRYCWGMFQKRPCNVKFDLADGLATSLEFKMAAEILKTVLVRDLNELMVLGAVILLRALLSLLIHVEMKGEKHESR